MPTLATAGIEQLCPLEDTRLCVYVVFLPLGGLGFVLGKVFTSILCYAKLIMSIKLHFVRFLSIHQALIS